MGDKTLGIIFYLKIYNFFFGISDLTVQYKLYIYNPRQIHVDTQRLKSYIVVIDHPTICVQRFGVCVSNTKSLKPYLKVFNVVIFQESVLITITTPLM